MVFCIYMQILFLGIIGNVLFIFFFMNVSQFVIRLSNFARVDIFK